MHGCCYNDLLRSGKISADPTTADTGYPTPYLAWTPEGRAFLHTGSGNWLDVTAWPPPDENGNGTPAPKTQKITTTMTKQRAHVEK